MYALEQIVANIFFIVIVIFCAVVLPMVVRRVKPDLVSEQVVAVYQAILYAYAVIFGFIIPFTAWVSNSVI